MPETETIKKEATSIKINPKLWKEFRIEALKEERTASDLLEELIESWIKERKRK